MKTEPLADWLRSGEQSARAYGAAAFREGRYELAEGLLRIAGIYSSLSLQVSHGPTEARRTGSLGSRAGGSPGDASPSNRGNGEAEVSSLRSDETVYPFYRRDDDNLVKVGASRQGGRYEHKVGLGVLRDVLLRIRETADRRRTFTIEDIQKAVSRKSELAVPNYQLYLCIGWLKERSLIQQHGRQGYRIVDPATLSEHVEAELAKIEHSTRNG